MTARTCTRARVRTNMGNASMCVPILSAHARPVRAQYTWTEMTWTMPAAISMRNKGMCRMCQTENNRS